MKHPLADQVTKKELIELLGKCWMTHDGMWFYNTLMESGIEKANKINKAAMKSLAPIEIGRLKKKVGIEEITTYASFRQFFSKVSELMIPEFMNLSVEFPGKGVVTWEFNERNCFAYNGIRMLGVIDAYECGPLYRIKCWLETLGIQYRMEPDIHKCVMPEKGRCAGRFVLQF